MARRFILSVGTLVCAADLISKWKLKMWIAQQGGVVEILPFLDLRSVHNTGVAFGLLADAGAKDFLVWFAFGLCLVVVVFVLLYKRLTYLQGFTGALIFGGGLGNGLDRMLNGSVYDFIDLHVGELHWPAFNVADVSISLAVILLLYQAFFMKDVDGDGGTERGDKD